ncbi:formylglycine-generating enzyme family protein [Pseudomonas subflava]|uniref:formylglycine-generating enzyme family protein n=1 Tax=Pseudomonas subflava TaxID=2952933 RepID=UPI00207AB64B
MKTRSLVLLGTLLLPGCGPTTPAPQVALVDIPAGTVRYQLPGAATPVAERIDGFAIMRRQVSQAEYAACVADGACAALDGPARGTVAADLPAVGLSWLDAGAYAAWLSRRRGERYRLPRYGEWVLAAGSAYEDEAPIVDDPRDPSRRWLAEYEREARRGVPSAQLLRFGGYGESSSGLLDVAGNVWEWTDSCFGPALGGFCGIRVAAGRHPSGLSDFVRDPVGGACSTGTPPTHLGLRLVREG